MGAELSAFIKERITEQEHEPMPTLSEEAVRALESLGYVE